MTGLVLALSIMASMPQAPPQTWSCGDLAPVFSRWVPLLGLQAWTMEVECSPSSASTSKNDKLGIAAMAVETQQAKIWIASDQTLASARSTAIHEILHLALRYQAEADSKVVEENLVRRLEYLLYEMHLVFEQRAKPAG